jgi:hypothetical protein
MLYRVSSKKLLTLSLLLHSVKARTKMTNKELLIQLLCDVTELSVINITTKVNLIIEAEEKNDPASTKGYYKNFSQEEAARILAMMHEDRRQIVKWFLFAYNRARTS